MLWFLTPSLLHWPRSALRWLNSFHWRPGTPPCKNHPPSPDQPNCTPKIGKPYPEWTPPPIYQQLQRLSPDKNPPPSPLSHMLIQLSQLSPLSPYTCTSQNPGESGNLLGCPCGDCSPILPPSPTASPWSSPPELTPVRVYGSYA